MITLQTFTFPENGICTEHDLYYHVAGNAGFSEADQSIWLDRGSRLILDTYFNLFNLSKWHEGCTLDGLFAEVEGRGRVEVRVFQAIPGMSWEILHCEVTTLEPGVPHLADLSHYGERSVQGLIYVEVKALGRSGATITGGRFATATVPATLPTLAVSITTFRREREVRATVARLESFLDDFAFGDRIRVQVVDNGASAEIPASDRVMPIANHNYGGAGGFARGLIEAEKAGFSHCLFMDDDASFHMENIARTYAFLALSKDRRNAVAGAMITNTHKWAMWESGAFFDGSCHPLYCGTDLRNRDAVFGMEFDSARSRPPTLYGGWWFFAFAIDQVKYHPFPFFVRGDDISFSLMNDFRIYTLNGVVSFQDDFSEKESAQTLYLDLRNHLIHHLVSDKLDRGAFGTAKIALRFTMRAMLRLHYETAEALLLSWEDVMRGPGFFDENIDMAERRATIRDMMRTEVWQDVEPDMLKERKSLTRWPRPLRHNFGVWTLNGHLVPFSGRLWDRIVLGIGERSIVFPAFGAARITYLNTAGNKAYTVTQSKRRFFALGWRMGRLLWRFMRDYDDLKAAYRSGYDDLTSPAYWERRLEIEAVETPVPVERLDTTKEQAVP